MHVRFSSTPRPTLVRAHRSKIWRVHILQSTINQKTTKNVTKWRDYCTKLSKNIESKYQKGPEIEFAPFNCKRKLECTVLVIIIAHFILFLFCNEHVKNFYDERTLTAKFTSHQPFNWTTHPPLSLRTLWITPSPCCSQPCSQFLLWNTWCKHWKSFHWSLNLLSTFNFVTKGISLF